MAYFYGETFASFVSTLVGFFAMLVVMGAGVVPFYPPIFGAMVVSAFKSFTFGTTLVLTSLGLTVGILVSGFFGDWVTAFAGD